MFTVYVSKVHLNYSVTDHDSMRTVDTHKCVTTKGTRGSGDPGVAGGGASRGLGTLELGSRFLGEPASAQSAWLCPR